MQKITPFLWFDHQAEEAARFYVSVFSKRKGVAKESRIISISRYSDVGGEATGKAKGTVLTVNFVLDGQPFVGLNGGPRFEFTEAVSFVIDCKKQAEVDYFWDKLVEGGQASRCGWLKDKYGLWWQVVPTLLNKLLTDKDPRKSRRVMEAMLKMDKIEIALLKAAAGKK